MTRPPLPPLLAVLARLESAGLRHALGASGLLASIGLADRVNDWDVSVDAPIDAVRAACAGEEFTEHGPDGAHADHKLTMPSASIELIAGLAMRVPSGIVRIPTVVTRAWLGLPVGSPTAWAVAYALLARVDDEAKRPRRAERAEALFAWIAARPAEAQVVARLLEEPLPGDLASRLRALG
jgi:hypothetical protein